MATILIDHRASSARTTPAHAIGHSTSLRPRPPEITVSANGTEIPSAAIAREVQNHPAESLAAAWAEAARALVVRELLLQEATRLGIEAQPLEDDRGHGETEEEALIRALLDRELALPEADEATCRRYYERNRGRFRTPDLFEAAHILFAADQGNATAFAEAVARAKSALDLLSVCPERFPDLARELSACPSAKLGGHLGQLTIDQVTPEFAAALDRLAPGGITSAPVGTRYGVHIIRLDRRIEGRVLPFEAVHEGIAAFLTDCVWRRAAAQYVALLAGRATITGVELSASDTPLVQ